MMMAIVSLILIVSLLSVGSLALTTHPLRYGGICSEVKSYPSSNLFSHNYNHALTSRTLLRMSGDDATTDSGKDSLYQTIGIVGVVSNIVCDYSLYILKTTGSGLPAGPYGLEGGIEGISYLAIVGIFAWSIITKIKTGNGLPAGPLGLLGAAEGLTFLTVLGGIVVAALNYLQYGYVSSLN